MKKAQRTTTVRSDGGMICAVYVIYVCDVCAVSVVFCSLLVAYSLIVVDCGNGGLILYCAAAESV
jgi:hypothetical protein